jgi:hypothetical protein
VEVKGAIRTPTERSTLEVDAFRGLSIDLKVNDLPLQWADVRF